MAEDRPAEPRKIYNEYNRRHQQDDWWSLSLRPRDMHRTISKGMFHWFVSLPLAMAFIWGIYSRDNIAGVVGVSGRRATGQVLNETKDFAKGVHSLQQGRGFQPGQLRGSDFDATAEKEEESKLLRR